MTNNELKERLSIVENDSKPNRLAFVRVQIFGVWLFLEIDDINTSVNHEIVLDCNEIAMYKPVMAE